jgi:hypothetical protein
MTAPPSKAAAAKKYRHGQHEHARVDGTFGQSNKKHEIANVVAEASLGSTKDLKGSSTTEDKHKSMSLLLADDHHSPMTAEDYLELRVRPQLCFYQQRLPAYEHQNISTEALLNCTTIAATAMAFFGYASWGALPAAVGTVLTAWSKFAMVDKKLQRYSDAVSSLDTIVRWWKMLGSVEKASLAKIDQLVSNCEAAFQTERQGWVATSMANQLLAAAGGSSEKEEKDKKKDQQQGADVALAEV